MTDFRALLETLASSEVEFIVVGGAAAAHGSTRLTLDLDIVYQRGRENSARLAKALAPYSSYLRGSPPGAFHMGRSDVGAGHEFHSDHADWRY